MVTDILVGVAVSILGALILLAAKLTARWLRKGRKNAIDVLDKILEWHRYLETKLDLPDFNQAEVDALEKEIEHQFQTSYLKKYSLHFRRRFVSKFMKQMGLKSSFRKNTAMFLSYARLADPRVRVALALQSEADHHKYTDKTVSFRFYWHLIEGNFMQFLSQYRANYRDVPMAGKKYTMADIDVSISVLRLYFKR